MPDEPDGIDWSLTTWEGSRREQLRRWSELTFDEILQAQEEMADLAEEFAAAPFRPPASATQGKEETARNAHSVID
jgi:hypothetical protein